MVIKDLFLLIYQVIESENRLSDYSFKIASTYVDVIPDNGSIGYVILSGLLSLDATSYVSTSDDGLYLRLFPKE